MDRALVEQTKKAITSISLMDSLKPYYLVGGTALSIQLNHRLSEDLDFMRWQKHKDERMSVDITSIRRELVEAAHVINSTNILSSNHVEFYIDGGVKLSFFAHEAREPKLKTIPYLNNIVLLDIETIAVLKLETLFSRSRYRDYYDLYFILKDKTPQQIVSIIDNTLKYMRHAVKSKNLLGMLINGEHFSRNLEFMHLEPISDISPREIASFMNETVKAAYQQAKGRNTQLTL
jgi:hypothetical protein